MSSYVVGLGETGRLEEVLAVDEQLDPRLARDRQLGVAVGGQLERALAERRRVEALEHLGRGVGVEQLVGRERADLAERDAADDVGQVAGRGVGGEDLGELVLRDRGQLDRDAALLGERVDDLLGRRDPVGEVLDDPDGQGVVAPATASTVVVVAAAGGEADDQGSDQAGRQERADRAGAAQPWDPSRDMEASGWMGL